MSVNLTPYQRLEQLIPNGLREYRETHEDLYPDLSDPLFGEEGITALPEKISEWIDLSHDEVSWQNRGTVQKILEVLGDLRMTLLYLYAATGKKFLASQNVRVLNAQNFEESLSRGVHVQKEDYSPFQMTLVEEGAEISEELSSAIDLQTKIESCRSLILEYYNYLFRSLYSI